MSRQADHLTALVDELDVLRGSAASVQGAQSLQMAEADIAELVGKYHDWYARALASLTDTDLQERLRDAYEGGFFTDKIKPFLAEPGQTNPFWDAETSQVFSYWKHPYSTTCSEPMMSQRQVLTEAKARLASTDTEDLDMDKRPCERFPEFILPLAQRQRSRPAVVPGDEYDVQDLLHMALRLHFDDVRAEDYVPERAGGRSRLDFLLKQERIIVEAKMTRKGLDARQVGNQLIEDIERYRAHPDCDAIVAFVYDPQRIILNRAALTTDLSGVRDGLVVRVIIAG